MNTAIIFTIAVFKKTRKGTEMITLKEKYKDYFKIGAAVNARTVESHSELLKKHFNSITCENEMKFSRLCEEENNYDFSEADKIVKFAKENNCGMRGHTFTWHNQTPQWVFENTNREELLKRLKNHIEIVGKRYKDDIYAWDVVNESIEDKEDFLLRKSPWSEIIGEDFMDYAFHYARETLPNTSLYYNDYNATDPVKSKKIYQAVKEMMERGVPIDGVGLQGHFNIYHPEKDQIRRAFELYAKLGLKLQITEMDISVYHHDSTEMAPSEGVMQLQAKAYENAFEIFREYKDILDSVTIWGVADDETWLDNFPVKNRKNWPLLFDEQHKEKEALSRILNF